MFKKNKILSLIYVMIGFGLILGLAACAAEPLEVEETISEPEIETTMPAVIESPEPSPTPDLPPTVLLVADGEFSSFGYTQTLSLLESLTEDSELSLLVLDAITPEVITPNVQVVIGVGSNLDLNALAANSPGVSFAAIDNPDAIVGNNLSVIGDPTNANRQQAFMAGYLSALISSDYKITALIPSDNPAQDLLGESFVVGGRFYCGICQPLYPPYNAFPQWEAMTSELGEEGFRPVITGLYNKGVDVVYVHGELVTPDLIAYLEELGMKVVSDRSPETRRDNWVGTIKLDPAPALELLWPDLLAGAPGVRIPAEIVLTDSELGLLSEGRYRLFKEMAEDLQEGMISLEIVP